MRFLLHTIWLKRILIIISVGIVSLILWNTYVFFQKFKQEERVKIEIFATAMKEFATNQNLNDDFNLENKVFESITNIPLILTDSKGSIIDSKNFDSVKSLNNAYLEDQLSIMKRQNLPIEIGYKTMDKQYVYYRDSDLLYRLTYYPITLLLILILFLSVIFLLFNSNKIAEQNKLWTGMAKETAHQIGTPLSSLLGWVTLLRSEHVDETYISEIEKDISRLNIIANRFSKIGSLPELTSQNIVLITKQVLDYLDARSSKQIQLSFSTSNPNIHAKLNKDLYGWVIENLIKNAIDAMQGKGAIHVKITTIDNTIKISISDTGKGLLKSQFKTIFKPGFTTKKRGWGLGLSLSKRIIKNYHNGTIFVKKSALHKGTTFEISLDRA